MRRFAADDVRSSYRGRVIAVGGPPHSGKSVFLNALHDALLRRMGDQAFLERVCPDGEGKWSAEADYDLVQQLRKKGSFSAEFMAMKLAGIEQLGRNKALVLLDLGGRRSPENAAFLKRSTDLLILTAKLELAAKWQTFAALQGCSTLGIFESCLVKLPSGEFDGKARSQLRLQQQPIGGRLVNLDRDFQQDCYWEALEQVADYLVND